MNKLYFEGTTTNLYASDYQYLQDTVSDEIYKILKALSSSTTVNSLARGFDVTINNGTSPNPTVEVHHLTSTSSGLVYFLNGSLVETFEIITGVELADYTDGTVNKVFVQYESVYGSYDRVTQTIIENERKAIDLSDHSLKYNRVIDKLAIVVYTSTGYDALTEEEQNSLLLIGTIIAAGEGVHIGHVDTTNVNYYSLNIIPKSITNSQISETAGILQTKVTQSYVVDDAFIDLPTNLEEDLNQVRTQIRGIKQTTTWDGDFAGFGGEIAVIEHSGYLLDDNYTGYTISLPGYGTIISVSSYSYYPGGDEYASIEFGVNVNIDIGDTITITNSNYYNGTYVLRDNNLLYKTTPPANLVYYLGDDTGNVTEGSGVPNSFTINSGKALSHDKLKILAGSVTISLSEGDSHHVTNESHGFGDQHTYGQGDNYVVLGGAGGVPVGPWINPATVEVVNIAPGSTPYVQGVDYTVSEYDGRIIATSTGDINYEVCYITYDWGYHRIDTIYVNNSTNSISVFEGQPSYSVSIAPRWNWVTISGIYGTHVDNFIRDYGLPLYHMYRLPFSTVTSTGEIVDVRRQVSNIRNIREYTYLDQGMYEGGFTQSSTGIFRPNYRRMYNKFVITDPTTDLIKPKGTGWNYTTSNNLIDIYPGYCLDMSAEYQEGDQVWLSVMPTTSTGIQGIRVHFHADYDTYPSEITSVIYIPTSPDATKPMLILLCESLPARRVGNFRIENYHTNPENLRISKIIVGKLEKTNSYNNSYFTEGVQIGDWVIQDINSYDSYFYNPKHPTAVINAPSLHLSHDLTVEGNFIVNGTTTTINTSILTVEDKNVVLAQVSPSSDSTADGGGITLVGGNPKTITWANDTYQNWTSSENWNLVTGRSYKINNYKLLSTSTGGVVKFGDSYLGQTSIVQGTWNASTVTVPYGGTGAITLTQNGLLYGNGIGAIGAISPGINPGTQFLRSVDGGVPTWVTLSAGSLGTVTADVGGTGLTTYSKGDMIYAGAASPTALTKLAATDPGNALVLSNPGSGSVPVWGKIYLDGSHPHVTGTLPTSNGGTGKSSAYTQYGVVFADTTTSLSSTSTGSVGRVLHATDGSAPIFKDIDLSGTGTSFTSGLLPASHGGTGQNNLSLVTVGTASTCSGNAGSATYAGAVTVSGDTSSTKMYLAGWQGTPSGNSAMYYSSAVSVTSGIVEATGFNATSSRVFKDKIKEFKESALDLINDLEIVSYNFKSDPNTKKVGFIAEDTHELLSTPSKSNVDITNSLGLLFKAVQELSSDIKIIKEML